MRVNVSRAHRERSRVTSDKISYRSANNVQAPTCGHIEICREGDVSIRGRDTGLNGYVTTTSTFAITTRQSIGMHW